jgi:hypothetical protein
VHSKRTVKYLDRKKATNNVSIGWRWSCVIHSLCDTAWRQSSHRLIANMITLMIIHMMRGGYWIGFSGSFFYLLSQIFMRLVYVWHPFLQFEEMYTQLIHIFIHSYIHTFIHSYIHTFIYSPYMHIQFFPFFSYVSPE